MPTLFLEFPTVFVIAILPQIFISFYPDEMRGLLGNLPGHWRFITTLPSRIGPILLILYISANRYDVFHSVGLNFYAATSSTTLITAFLLTCYLLLIFVFAGLRSKKKDEITEQQYKTLTALRYLKVNSFWKRLLSFIDLWLAVIGEELVYRGYLVLLLGRQTGSFVPWVILSLTLSVLVHLYQGRTVRLVFTHIIFASLFILAVLVTKSLIAALIPHLVYNTIWLMRALKNMSKQEERSAQPSS